MQEELPPPTPEEAEVSKTVAIETPALPEQTTSSPWKLPTWQAIFLALFAATVTVVVFLRLYQLDTLQAEVYGDIEIVLSYMNEIFMGLWPKQFVLSAGPLYHYLIAPIIYLTGSNYNGAKLASVIVSLGGLAATYAFGRRLVNDYFAVLALFVAGVSSWLLVFSRLGNSQIALPVLTMLSLWLVIRIVQFGQKRDVIACAIVSTLGLFIYPQSFVQPGVIFATLLCLHLVKQPMPKRWYAYFIAACIPGIIIFWFIFASDPGNYNGYIGNKIQPAAGGNPAMLIGANILKTAMALHVEGDHGYRSNPPGLPHLDWLSGILLIVGIVFWGISKENRRWIPLWLVPLVLLQVPSILVISNVHEVPSASRTLGAAPIFYVLVASGIWWLAQEVYKRVNRWAAAALVAVLLSGILYLNVQRYFNNYIAGLPYDNTPIGNLVAQYANQLSEDTQIYMIGCCWVDGVPDNFVKFDMVRPDNMHYTEPASVSCTMFQSLQTPAVLIWNFNNEIPAPQLEQCKHWMLPQLHSYQNQPIFNAATLHVTEMAIIEPIAELVHDTLQLNGESVSIDYSPIDMGSIGDLTDGKQDTLMRGANVNPMIIMLRFPTPRKAGTLELSLGSLAHFQVKVTVAYTDDTSQEVMNDYLNLPADPQVSITLPDAEKEMGSLTIEIQDLLPPADAVHIHIRELKLH
jgi:4-amino-4-deoxy-L-arabinose transferase-like glycosyltransferase